MIVLALTLWLIGWGFTVGVMRRPSARRTPLTFATGVAELWGCVLLWFLWPLELGEQVARYMRAR